MYYINEIFHSIQGEGYWTGKSAVFIRFAGCNLKCEFCDTEFTSSRAMDARSIVSEISRFHTHHVVLTGGEPLMQDVRELTGLLKREGYYIQVETNGMFSEGIDDIDWITVSPKNSSVVIKRAQEVKYLLDSGGRILSDIHIPADHYFISPINPGHDGPVGSRSSEVFDRAAALAAADWVMDHPEYRLSLQIHKILGVR